MKRKLIAIFIAATSALAITTSKDLSTKAGENDSGIKRMEYDMSLTLILP